MTTPAPETIERKPMTPEAFAKQMGWGAKRVRQLAKKLGACRVLGNRMALMPEDIEVILEATKPCPSSSLSGERAMAEIYGTTAGQLPDIDYAARLAQRTAKSRRELRPRSKPEPTNVISMGRKRP
jgi:hypothetical protein